MLRWDLHSVVIGGRILPNEDIENEDIEMHAETMKELAEVRRLSRIKGGKEENMPLMGACVCACL